MTVLPATSWGASHSDAHPSSLLNELMVGPWRPERQTSTVSRALRAFLTELVAENK